MNLRKKSNLRIIENATCTLMLHRQAYGYSAKPTPKMKSPATSKSHGIFIQTKFGAPPVKSFTPNFPLQNFST